MDKERNKQNTYKILTGQNNLNKSKGVKHIFDLVYYAESHVQHMFLFSLRALTTFTKQ